jgi:all-trans-8'-apo-beta-carotenal 15,15'-oxygenase
MQTALCPKNDTESVQPQDFAPGIEATFFSAPTEDCYLVEDVDGHVPDFLVGTYYLNGPALFSRAGFNYKHWLDGDGMVCSVRFDDEGVRFCNRFVRTTKYVAEQKADKFVFRAFGTAFPGSLLNRGVALESPANVSVYSYDGALLAFGEQALPWQLDADTLETVGQFNFNGSLTEFSPFAAHPKFDPRTGEMFNFGIFYSTTSPKLCFYRFSSSRELGLRVTHSLQHPISAHDFGLSANYAVFYLSPYLVDVERMRRSGDDLMSSFGWMPELGSRLLVLSRDKGQVVASIPLGAQYCLHFLNSFEEDNMLVVDVIELDRPVYDQYGPLPDVFTDVQPGGPVRLGIDLEKRQVTMRQELDYRLAADFPTIDPIKAGRSYKDFWMLGLSATGRTGRKFFDQLVHARWDRRAPNDIFQAPAGQYLGGEPIFAGDPQSESAVVICQRYDARAHQSSFLIFDALRVAAGPTATLRLKRPVPFGFHASWNPGSRFRQSDGYR